MGDHEDKRASRRVADELRKQIQSGTLSPGSKLPTVRQLEVDYGVARNTASAAVRLLRDEGLVDAQPRTVARVRIPSEPVSRDQETRDLRDEVVRLRATVHEVNAVLADADKRLSDVAVRLAALSRRSDADDHETA